MPNIVPLPRIYEMSNELKTTLATCRLCGWHLSATLDEPSNQIAQLWMIDHAAEHLHHLVTAAIGERRLRHTEKNEIHFDPRQPQD